MDRTDQVYDYDGQVLEIGMVKRHGVAGLLLYVPKRIAERMNLSSTDKSLVLLFEDEIGLICIKDSALAQSLSPKIQKARQIAIALRSKKHAIRDNF